MYYLLKIDSTGQTKSDLFDVFLPRMRAAPNHIILIVSLSLTCLLLVFDPLGNGDNGGTITILERLDGFLDELEGGHDAILERTISRYTTEGGSLRDVELIYGSFCQCATLLGPHVMSRWQL